MPSKSYTVAKTYTSKSPPGKGVRLENAGPPPEVLVITDPDADEWVLFNAAYGATVTVTTDATGARTGVSRP